MASAQQEPQIYNGYKRLIKQVSYKSPCKADRVFETNANTRFSEGSNEEHHSERSNEAHSNPHK